MTQTYRTTDLTKWGTGKGSRLTPTEVDINFWDVIQRLVTLEALPDPSAGIDHFSVTGSDFYVHMTDATVLGPYVLPVATFTDKGTWAPLTAYDDLDTFVINGGIYLVLFPHTSAASFDAGANDGSGHDYYKLMIQTPGNALPTGGAPGQVVKKTTIVDFAVAFGWVDATEVTFTASTGSSLSSDNVADALEELESDIGDAIAGLDIQAADVNFVPVTGSALTSTNVADALEELSDRIVPVIGRQTMWIPASAMIQRTTNGPSAGSIELSSNKIMIKTLDFDSSTQEFAQFWVALPKSCDLSGSGWFYTAYWSHAATTTNFGVDWALEFIGVSNDEAMDQGLSGFVEVTDTGGTTNHLYISPESGAFPLTGAAAEDLVLFQISRFPSSGSDTLAIDARLHGIKLIYTTNAATDD